MITDESDVTLKDQRRLTKHLSDKQRTSGKIPEEQQSEIWDLPASCSGHVPAKLDICVGMPVMLRHNDATECCITKGAEATVVYWDSSIGVHGKPMIDTLFVKLKNPAKDVEIAGLPVNIIPLTRRVDNITVQLLNGETVSIARHQVPVILNFAMTDYNSQGRTRIDNVVDLQNCCSCQAYYTVLSRSASSGGTIIVQGFQTGKVQGGLSGFMCQEFRELELLDEITRLKYEGLLPQKINGHLRNTLIQKYRQFKGDAYVPDAVHPAIVWSAKDPLRLSSDVDVAWQIVEDPRKKGAKRGAEKITKPKKEAVGTFVVALGTTAGPAKRKSEDVEDERPTKRKKATTSRGAGNAVPSGMEWDSVNWSCCYDAMFSVLYNVWASNPRQWTTVFRSWNPTLRELSGQFRKYTSGQIDMTTARDRVSNCAVDCALYYNHAENSLLEVVSRAGDHQLLRFNDAPILRISNCFTGRDLELDLISRALSRSSNNEPSRFAIHGMPGLGKSQLVLQFSKLAYASHVYAYIFWVSATTIEKLTQGLTSVLYLVDHKDRSDPDQALRLVAARRWLERSPDNWLLILDDVTADVIPFLREHLPHENTRGAIIITTRTSQVAEVIVNAGDQQDCILELKPLTAEKSVDLLAKASGLQDQGNKADQESFETLAKQLGCLPLALEQAGVYMKQKHTPARELQTLYGGSALKNVIHWENTLSSYEKRSVIAAFSVPLQNLRQVSLATSNLFNVLAHFDPESIPLSIIAHGAQVCREGRLADKAASSMPKPSARLRMMARMPWKKHKSSPSRTSDYNANSGCAPNAAPHSTSMLETVIDLICSKDSLREAMNCFEECSLAQPSFGDNPSLHIHDLIQLVVLNQSRAADQVDECHAVAVTLLTSAFSTLDNYWLPQCWAEYERFVPHLMSLEKHHPVQAPPSKEFIDMSQDIAKYFHQRGRYNEAEALLIRVLAQREKAAGIGEDLLDTLGTVQALAEVYRALGKYDKAEEFLGRALAGREKQIGADHRDTLGTLNGLARLRHLQHRYNDAEELYTRLLEKQKVQLGAEHLDTLGAVNGLAHVYAKQGKFDDAMPFYKRVLAGHENQRGSEHPNTLAATANLGELYREQGNYDEAEPLLARVLRGLETQLGEEHPDTLDVAHKLARLYDAQGKYDEAETLYARVLAGEEKRLGAEHPETLVAVHNFALLHERQGRWEEAEELYRRALAGKVKVRGDSHPSTRATMENLASFYQRQGRNEEAEALRARLREVEQKA
ncbi:hypothetical protein HWV62_4615 [Athelia sp. TMB]|nr:hypothetical protein HWV62_4615 [Athelia sp. TMB]